MVFNYLLDKIAGNANEKRLAKYNDKINKINNICEKYNSISFENIKKETEKFKQRLTEGESLDDILPEAFGLHKQACQKLIGTQYKVKGEDVVWNMVPYDVQILGGIILHEGIIAEMKTGEGKTLVATFAAYLNALSGKGVHLVTVNDYLAERDAQTMKPLYDCLGVSVGTVSKNFSLQDRKQEYSKDITYVENSELGFDYLRDNLAKEADQRNLLFRELNYAIVDEADSIMIDEARTPLIISQPSEEPTEKYVQYANIVKSLEPCPLETKKKKSWLFDDGKKEPVNGDYKIDPKAKTALLTSIGIKKLEDILKVENLYRDLGYEEIHHLENALRAKACYEKDKDYLVNNGQVLIIDENTGRAMPGRRYSEGLHQAIESKENVTIQKESETVATITYQNFLKLYNKLAGMTGTAATEGEEFEKIYNSSVVVVPTNEPIIRVDKTDKVFFDQNIKFNKVVETVKFYHKMGLPFLLGTSSVQTSEILSKYLQKAGLKHSVLNAKYHEMEAKIVSNAGKIGSIIVATNMAGRGTDIKLEEGMFDKIAKNYANWTQNQIKEGKGVSFVFYSRFEFDKVMEELKNVFILKDNDIINAEKKELEKENIYIKVNFNTKKKNKNNPYCEIFLKPSKASSVELIEKNVHMGLYVLASEKHESRRIDNQLRGRSGRQGDPGITQFYVALDDDIMVKSGGLVTKNLASKIMPKEDLENYSIENTMITNSIGRAQRNMEGMSFSMRKNLFEYDSVLNQQRQFIYSLRDKLLNNEDVSKIINQYIDDLVYDVVDKYQNDIEVLKNYLKEISGKEFGDDIKNYKNKDLKYIILKELKNLWEEKIKEIGEEKFKEVQKVFMLEVLDKNWMKHIDDMMYLRDKVSMYGYAQIDPLLQYKKDAFEKYKLLMGNIKNEIISSLMKLDPSRFQETEVLEMEGDEEVAQNLIDKLKKAGAEAKTFENKASKQQEKKGSKTLEKNNDFEVIEMEDNENKDSSNLDKEANDIINKMLGK